MLSGLRSLIKSKFGVVVAALFLIVIIFAFTSGDLSNFTSSVTGDDSSGSVAVVGGKPIDQQTLTQSMQVAFQRIQQQQPTATMGLMIAQGALDDVLNDLVDRVAVGVWGQKHGIVAGDRLIDSEIASIPAFAGVDGKFSQDTFKQALAQRNITEQSLRDDIAQGLIARQLVVPAGFGTVMPKALAERYAAMLGESREGAIIEVPALAFAPQGDPSAAQLNAYYNAHITRFQRPERRTVRYALFDEAAMKNVPAPTDAEIAAQYQKDQAQYAAQNLRSVTQLIVADQNTANAVEAEVKGGKSLDDVAKAKGLSTAKVGPLDNNAFANQISQPVANAIFAAPSGQLLPPQKGVLGWYVIRIDSVTTKPAQSLDQVKADIAKTLATAKQTAAFSAMLSKIQSQFDGGAGLPDVAKAMGLEVKTSEPITADGKVYGKPQEALAPELVPVIKTAFSMEQNQPQVAEAVRGKSVILFDVSQIDESAPAPLAQIKGDVAQAYKLDAGFDAAKGAALKVRDAVLKAKDPAAGLSAAGKPLPPVQPIGLSRAVLTQMMQQGRQIPPPVSLLFHMAQGTVKVQAAPDKRGWFVVFLKTVKPGAQVPPQAIASAQTELGQQQGDEYTQALTKAIRKDVGVIKHPAAIKTVVQQLGGNAPAASTN
ncbi:peptidylprolyl isomerase [Novosphingobium sp. 9]|uniref:peptidylprolyl isomerase n=1 Tax=Novosphingobium sp. 9 TaxID=2025349 RepID=UPI0021B687ED|nr:peptidylprolyl isomerase [Novosphingobium sp. 9]